MQRSWISKGLIPADEEVWHLWLRALVANLHRKDVAEMVGLFGREAFARSLALQLAMAIYIVIREAQDCSIAIIPYSEIPIIKDFSPRQQQVAVALKLIK